MGRGLDGVCETMAKGRLIYVLSLEIAGNSTSARKAWLSTSMDPLSREKMRARKQCSARFGTGSRRKRVRMFFGKIER